MSFFYIVKPVFNSKFSKNNDKLKVRNIWNDRYLCSEYRHVVITEEDEENGLKKN
jgi:hypothetical protein